jgi:HK97 family phage portal protein
VSLIARLIEAFRPRAATTATGAQVFEDWRASAAGLPVLDERTAWTVSAVASCVNLIAGAVSGLPFNVYRLDADGFRDRDPTDRLWWTLNEEWAPRWSATAGWTHLMESRLFLGDGFVEIVRAPGGGRVAALRPHHPRRVDVAVDFARDRLVYTVHAEPGSPLGSRVIDQDDMIHVPSAGFNGLRSPSPLRHGLLMSGAVAAATQDFSARFFANSARPDYALVSPTALGPEAIDQLRAQIDERHRGTDKSHRPMLLQGGLDVKLLSMPIEDMQLIATRQFQIEEIARVYGVPPFMIGHTEKTTSWGSGVSEMGKAFVRYALDRHLKQIRTEFNRKLYPRRYDRVLAFDTFALEEADMKNLMEAFRVALGRAGEGAIMTPDEVRERLNLRPMGAQTMEPADAPVDPTAA